jgi:L-lactate dehydrogenase complex protein LldG
VEARHHVRERERILTRVREALEERPGAPHPGPFGGWRPHRAADSAAPGATLDAFTVLFHAAGGEAVRVADAAAAVAWMAELALGAAGSGDARGREGKQGTGGSMAAAVGRTVPDALRPPLDAAPPETAPLGVSMARGAVAETGSLLMDARDGRRAQLLPPTHVVVVRADTVYATLREALAALREDLPSAVGLHSGPSKSADLGQVLVRGVHGPGRLIAVIVGLG